jgi:hypothetical protein
MQCDDCQATTTTSGLWRQFNAPLCKYCSARFIQQLPKVAVRLTREEVKTARLKVMAEAVAWGHSEREIRDLAASKTMAVQPLQTKAKK